MKECGKRGKEYVRVEMSDIFVYVWKRVERGRKKWIKVDKCESS